jgi:hypothetical protein
MVDAATRKPARVSITNLVTGEGWMAMFNPTQFEEGVGVNYTRQNVPGLSHKPLQYAGTDNYKFELALYYRAQATDLANPFAQSAVRDKKPKGLSDVLEMRKFLQSLCYPVQSTTVGGGGPPRVLVVWPNVITLVCVVVGLKIQNRRFNVEGTPVEYVANVTFEEIRDDRIDMDEVRDLGTERNVEEG